MTDLHVSAGSYALNALDRAELAEFEAHLAGCEVCQAEVAELCATAAELSLLSLATPPPALRDNVLAAIQTAAQVPAEVPDRRKTGPPAANASRPAPESVRAVRSAGPRRALPEVSEGPASRADEFALRRQRRRRRALGSLVAALLALAVGLGGVLATVVRARQAETTQITLEQQLYAAPDTTFTTTDLKGGGKATFVFSEQLNRAQFIATDLPDPGRDKRYQLWTMTGPEPKWVVATSITRDTTIPDREPAVEVFFSGNVARADWLCVSIEPKDNTSNRPTVPPAGAAKV